MKDHGLIDERSLAFGHAIATHLKERPELLEVARENITRWMKTCTPRVRPELEEWLGTLNAPLDGVLHLLTSRDERSVRLRQSNPFAGVLSQRERTEILLQFQAYDAART